MFMVRQGERSPRVTLLQILLNNNGHRGSNGRSLKVDGIFGRNTHFAVESYQRSIGSPPSGALAGPDMWNRLLAGTGLAVVSSVDVDDPTLMHDVRVLQGAGDNPVQLGGMCNGVSQMVTSVIGAAGGEQIVTLRLNGHGNLGRWLTVSVGDIVHLRESDPAAAARVDAEDMSYISASNFRKVAPVLNHLTTHFAPFGFAEHHGCSLGSKSPTRAMLERLADLWGVPVSVGVRTQSVGMILEFEGSTFTAFPGKHNLGTWSLQFQNASIAGVCAA